MSHNLDTPLSSQKLFLSSQFATTKLSNSNMIFELDQPIRTEGKTTPLLALESASIPLSFYLVGANTNTLILTDDGVGGATITVADGNYNVNQIIDELNADAYISANSYEFSYNSITSKITLTNTNFINFTILSTGLINPLLGFSTTTNQDSDVDYKIVGVDVVNLAGTTSVYVMCPNLTTANIDSALGGNHTPIIARIPVNQSANTYLQYINLTQFRSSLQQHVIANIQIVLLDDNRNELIYGDNSYFSLTIRIDYTQRRQLQFDQTLLQVLQNDMTIKQKKSLNIQDKEFVITPTDTPQEIEEKQQKAEEKVKKDMINMKTSIKTK